MTSGYAAGAVGAFRGTVVLALIKVDTCNYTQKDKLSIVSCTDPGAFKTTGRRATARYSWTWSLAMSNGAVSGNGTETGRLTLTFKSGALTLLTAGRTQPSNPPGSLETTGKWRVASGTGTYSGASGSGSFDFRSIEDRSISLPTRTGSITISGAVS
jgi:hypothetical protein